MTKIILASGSPRRIELLRQAGIKFKAVESGFKEVINNKLKPHEVVKVLSAGKARAVARGYTDAIIIGADTIIAFKGKTLGKPHTPKKAREMLGLLSGSFHFVYTGFTVIDAKTGKTVSKAQRTKILFRKISPQEIEEYISTGEPLDRAGAYAIQGGAKKFLKKMVGDYDNVLGLPVKSLISVLCEITKK